MPEKLPRSFFSRNSLSVTQELLGKRLVRLLDSQRLSGHIVEVEAYIGTDDQASHARPGLTERNAPMFGPAGHLYVYLIYGVHHCLNVVTESSGFPAALLIRALEPLEGIPTMQRLRGSQPYHNLTNGPGKLCQALGIDRDFSGLDMCAPDSPIWIEDAPPIPTENIKHSPRIGVRGDPQALQAPWRYYVQGNRWVSQ